MEPHGYEVRVSPRDLRTNQPNISIRMRKQTQLLLLVWQQSTMPSLKPIDRMYVFGQRGSLKTLSGHEQPVVTITPQDVQQGSAKLAHPSFVRFNGVKASLANTGYRPE